MWYLPKRLRVVAVELLEFAEEEAHFPGRARDCSGSRVGHLKRLKISSLKGFNLSLK